jgi:hypothetical protein
MSASPSERARDAALTRWAHSDPVAGTQRARDAFLATFENAVDPDGILDPAERERRAARLRRVHFRELNRKSWASRRARATGQNVT